MTNYDAVADRYDGHYTRPIDQWENTLAERILRPYVDHQIVLDLGAGTGWVADAMRPAGYVAVDASAGMLAVLEEKHPDAATVKERVGSPGWTDRIPGPATGFDSVVSTWAAHDFPNLDAVLRDLLPLVRPGGHVILHGSSYRYKRRSHYVLHGLDTERAFMDWDPDRCRDVTPNGFTYLGAKGTGALNDRLAVSRPLWALVAALTPPVHHYAFAAIWRRQED